jgi:DNA-binding NarL/FixJ family response regulator
MNRIRVLLADDHALVRRGFRRLLEDEPDIEIVGEAADGPEAVQQAVASKPDVVVMDYALPIENGALSARRILASLPDTKILMLSMHSEPGYVAQARDAGAAGYLLKNAQDLELVDAIRRTMRGEWVQDPRLASAPAALPGRRALTTRELEVLQHIVSGKSNKEVAAVLNLSVNTVSVHRANIMDALGVHNTAELTVLAIRRGLVTLA